MSSTNLPSVLIEDFVTAHRSLIKEIKQATTTYKQQNHSQLQATDDWENRVLPNLEKAQFAIDKALQSQRVGDSDPIRVWAATRTGLAKDLDNFDLSWADSNTAQSIDAAISEVVVSASKLYNSK